MITRFTRTLLFCCTLLITSCDHVPDWIGKEEAPPLPGERIAILALASDLEPDPTLNNTPVALPKLIRNKTQRFPQEWHTAHLFLSLPLRDKTEVDIGSSPDEYRLQAAPIAANGLLYTLDGGGHLTARALDDITETRWSADIRLEEVPSEFLTFTIGKTRKNFQGGSLAYAGNMLFVSTGNGRISAFDGKSGALIWERSINIPARSAPVATAGKLFIITVDNQLYALDANDGKTLWTHAGIKQNTSILGSPTPAVSDQFVVVPYSSGELYALSPANGRPIWAEMLLSSRKKQSSLFRLNDIDASPVIAGNAVYAVSHEGLLTAIELSSGRTIWEQHISSLTTPWIAGNWLFILSSNDELICIHAPDGRIKWVTQLPRYTSPSNKKGKIAWNGPVLASEKLYVIGSHGELVALSPASGEISDQLGVDDDIYLPPVIIDGTLFLLSNDATLTALR